MALSNYTEIRPIFSGVYSEVLGEKRGQVRGDRGECDIHATGRLGRVGFLLFVLGWVNIKAFVVSLLANCGVECPVPGATAQNFHADHKTAIFVKLCFQKQY